RRGRCRGRGRNRGGEAHPTRVRRPTEAQRAAGAGVYAARRAIRPAGGTIRSARWAGRPAGRAALGRAGPGGLASLLVFSALALTAVALAAARIRAGLHYAIGVGPSGVVARRVWPHRPTHRAAVDFADLRGELRGVMELLALPAGRAALVGGAELVGAGGPALEPVAEEPAVATIRVVHDF